MNIQFPLRFVVNYVFESDLIKTVYTTLKSISQPWIQHHENWMESPFWSLMTSRQSWVASLRCSKFTGVRLFNAVTAQKLLSRWKNRTVKLTALFSIIRCLAWMACSFFKQSVGKATRCRSLCAADCRWSGTQTKRLSGRTKYYQSRFNCRFCWTRSPLFAKSGLTDCRPQSDLQKSLHLIPHGTILNWPFKAIPFPALASEKSTLDYR